MFFEGSEKKAELMVTSNVDSLLLRDREYWSRIVDACGAKILSEIKTDECHAYLLSESSLFVWENVITLITCGTTTLVKSIEMFIQDIGMDNIQSLIFERKNEYFPFYQKTDFFKDVQILQENMEGKAFRFGDADTHHLHLFHLNKKFLPPADDSTLEILMYDLHGSAKEVFQCSNQSLEMIREVTGIDKLFDGFTVDDHVFDPCGYSINALRGSDYYTFHVTPQEENTYVSFETNIHSDMNPNVIIDKVIKIFKPSNFDVVIFQPINPAPLAIEGYMREKFICEQLECGYDVIFANYFQPTEGVGRAVELNFQELL